MTATSRKRRAQPADRTAEDLLDRFRSVRGRSLQLAAPLTPEDQCIQSMPDVSPTKWHLAHVTWFFETFILVPEKPGYAVFDPHYNYLFNSYYVQVGPRHARPERGLLSRPPLRDVLDYRAHVDDAIAELVPDLGPGRDDVLALLELGINHEQQHQELMLTDIKHVFSCNPLKPAYEPPRPRNAQRVPDLDWVDHAGGLVEIGHDGRGFAFDCEGPRHKVWLEPFRLATRPVTNGEYLEFMEDDGYGRAELWLSDGWAVCQANGWEAPGYWQRDADGRWVIFTLAGLRPLDPSAPVCHVSHFEADAYARWAGKRLPSEAEWEVMAAPLPVEGHFAERREFHPVPSAEKGLCQVFGDVWEWTRSAYAPYPGFAPAEGAVGEYNGKFMSGQMVLRGGSCVTPEGHVRATYRNFFYPKDRWQFTGIRLADDGAPGGTGATAAPVVTVDASLPGRDVFLDDVTAGLSATRKRLSPKYFYDAAGSELFNRICAMESYYQTRTETAILTDHAAEIGGHFGANPMLVEYGCGSLDKIRILLDAVDGPATVVAIDISEAQLEAAARLINDAYPAVTVLPVVADFTHDIDLPPEVPTAAAPIAFFPGSTIGNFEPADAARFLAGVRRTVGDRGMLLIGVDLKKDPARIVAAYDDAEGITEAFNKNVLMRINRELGGTFDGDAFEHRVRYDAERGRIEMHLESRGEQTVRVGGREFAFRAGETIHTENSYKYTIAEFSDLVAGAGFAPLQAWTDDEELFAVLLFRAAAREA